MSANPADESARLHAVVTGFVQGVSFRYYTVLKAESLGIVGWVRNMRDRSVEVTAEGSRSDLEALLDFLKVGPPAAEVSDVQVTWQAATGEFKSFDVGY